METTLKLSKLPQERIDWASERLPTGRRTKVQTVICERLHFPMDGRGGGSSLSSFSIRAKRDSFNTDDNVDWYSLRTLFSNWRISGEGRWMYRKRCIARRSRNLEVWMDDNHKQHMLQKAYKKKAERLKETVHVYDYNLGMYIMNEWNDCA